MQHCSSHRVVGNGTWELCSLQDQSGYSRFSCLLMAEPLAQTLDTRAHFLGICLWCCPHAGIAALPPTSLRLGRQPSRSLSKVSWNPCISTKQFTLIRVFWSNCILWKENPSKADVGLFTISHVCNVLTLLSGRGCWASRVPWAVSRACLPYFFMCILYAKHFQAGCLDAAAWNLLSRNRNTGRSFPSIFLFQFSFFLALVNIFVLHITWLKGKSRRVMVSCNYVICIESQ